MQENKHASIETKGTLEDLLGAVHFNLISWYLEISLLEGEGVETSERVLHKRDP